MNPKASAILEKACEERRRSNFKKAMDRLEEGIEKFPGEFALYTEAIDVGMEAGESLRAIQVFKKAQHRLPDQGFEVWTYAAERVGAYNDSIMGRFLVEHAVKTGDLAAAASVLEQLKDHAVSDLLERIRIKKQTMTVARGQDSSGRGEIASFTLTEALLSLRIGRMQAAMDGFVAAIEEDPGVAKRIEPFLADLESRGEGKGETTFALGCCLIERADFSQGLEKLSHAARLAPALAPRVIERIESIAESPDLPLDLRDLALAQLYLGQGDRTRASRILKKTIERTPAKAADAVDLLRSFVETIDEDLETQFVFVGAALTAGRRETALGHLRKIHKDKRHTTRLVEWLESRPGSQSGSTDIQLFFAETALGEGLYGKAVDIYKEILSHGNHEDAIIRELLSRHQSVPVVRAFYNDRFAASREKAREKAGAFELERYDTQGFRPRETGPAAENEPAPGQSEDGPAAAGAEPFQTVESLFHQAAAAGRVRAEAPSSDFDNRDFSLRSDEPAAPAAPASVNGASAARASVNGASTERAPAPVTPTAKIPAAEKPVAEKPAAPPSDETSFRDVAAFAETPEEGDAGGSDFFEYLKRHSPDDEAEPQNSPVPPVATVPRDESPLRDEAARQEQPLFANDVAPQGQPLFRNDVAPEDDPAPPSEASADAEAPGDGVSEDDAVSEDEDYRDFDSLFRAFLDGRLDHARTIEAAGRALDEGRMEEMKRLLSFDPANLGEDIARKYHLARYYLEKDQPLPALVALKTVHLNSLGREERKDFMLRIAECYRGLHNFDAAHAIYLRIMTEQPGLPDVEALARVTYARYVETGTGSAAALEKTTTL